MIRHVLALAIAAATLGAPPASAAPPSPPTQTSEASHRITLITGDVVEYTERSDGRKTAQIHAAPRDGEEPIFHTMTTAKGLHVYPSDAMGAITSGTVERTLFNVTELVRTGQSDDRTTTVPVLMTGGFSANAHTRIGSLNASGIRVEKAKAREFWTSLDMSAKSGVRVTYDRPIRITLDQTTKQIGAPEAWSTGLDGRDVTVAVVDTGIDANHPDVARKITAAENFSDEPDVTDRHGHGTHVAATVAGTGQGSAGKYKGVAPAAKLVIAKVFNGAGEAETSQVMAGIEWAARSGAKIVNLSLGGEVTDGTDELSALVDRLSAETGVLFVVAAGNNGPAGRSVTSPGAATSALTVGAVDRQNKLAPFSSTGPRIGDAHVKPEINAPGVGVVAARAADTSMGAPVGDGYTAASGTSMATPHVAGAAALLAQQHPGWNAQTLKNALVTSAADVGMPWYEQGTGRLDVARAVRQKATATASASFGRYERGPRGVLTREIQYVNDSGTPLTLDLAATIKGWDGKSTTGFNLSTTRLAIAAHSKASAVLTLDPEVGPAGVYGGVVTATGGGASLRTAVSVYEAPQTFPVSVHVRDTAGRPPAPATGQLIDDSNGGDDVNDPFDETTSFYFDVVNGEGIANVPSGRYSAVTWTTENTAGVRRWSALAAPELTITGAASVSLDAQKTVPIEVVPPGPAEQRDRTVTMRRVVPAEGEKLPLITEMAAVLGTAPWEIRAIPAAAVKKGAISLQDNVTLQSATVTLTSGGRTLGTDGDVAVLSAKWAGDRDLTIGGDTALVKIKPDTPANMVKAANTAATSAAQAGKKAILSYVDAPGALPLTGLASTSLPSLGVSNTDGEFLAKQTAVKLSVKAVPEAVYNLSFLDANGIPADHRRTVDPAKLVKRQTAYHADKPGLTVQKTWYPFPTGLWQSQILRGTTFTPPAAWTEYIGPGDERIVWKRHVTLSGLDARGQRAAMTMFQENLFREGAAAATERWFAGPVHSTAIELQSDHPARYPAANGAWRQLCSNCRAGDIFVPQLQWTDGTPGHYTNPYQNSKFFTTTKVRLFRGDTEVPAVQEPLAFYPTFQMVPEKATYRLETVETHAPGAVAGAVNAVLFTLAPRTETTWTFQSHRSQNPPPLGYSCHAGQTTCQFQPLIRLRHDLPLSLTNTAPAGKPFVYHVRASSSVPVTLVKVQWSADEGRTWRQAAIQPSGDRWEVTVDNPAGDVWLRTEARDGAGNTVTQTMQKAFRTHSGG
ncbi:subtilisin family serine protease [Lentzea atacamensis]|uniref:Subtilisin family serine protease n=1 Tax=Lentzea atacamensis TaxID=531938 RepID=A0ABX9EMN6_9PSEU|nr:S8 family serine peptidase [Lentzea atacamensis]RAS71386.1 subtilisin family serine protease [Lentzea atacamensis]